MSYLTEPARLIAALEYGVPCLPSVVSPGEEVIVAAGVWGDFGSVVVLGRDEEDDSLVDDVYLLARSADGRWQAPDSSSGSGMPEWVLQRPLEPLPEWRGDHMLILGAQVARVAECWVAELTVMASRAVTGIEVRYGGESITTAVPESGLVTLPGVIRSVADAAEFRGFDDAGTLLSTRWYRPVTESDLRDDWPAGSLNHF